MSDSSGEERASEEVPKRDWWSKASIISGFVSSIVIALVGISIGYSIQRAQLLSAQKSGEAQIAIAKEKAQDDKRLQEGQLTAQFVKHLVSKDPMERELAVVGLHASVPDDVFERVVLVVARNDPSLDVRLRAIEQLSRSSSPSAVATLVHIAQDNARASSERSLAGSSVLQMSARQAALQVTSNSATLLIASAEEKGQALDTGPSMVYSPFAEAVIRGISGAANEDADALISGSELGRYVCATIPVATTLVQQPIWLTKGTGDISIGPPELLRTRYRRIAAILVGVSKIPQGRALAAPARDIPAVAALFRKAGADTIVLLNSDATKQALEAAFKRISESRKPYDFFVFYYTGPGTSSADGMVRWLLDDIGNNSLTAAEINDLSQRVHARNKAILVDSSYAGALSH